MFDLGRNSCTVQEKVFEILNQKNCTVYSRKGDLARYFTLKKLLDLYGTTTVDGNIIKVLTFFCNCGKLKCFRASTAVESSLLHIGRMVQTMMGAHHPLLYQWRMDLGSQKERKRKMERKNWIILCGTIKQIFQELSLGPNDSDIKIALDEQDFQLIQDNINIIRYIKLSITGKTPEQLNKIICYISMKKAKDGDGSQVKDDQGSPDIEMKFELDQAFSQNSKQDIIKMNQKLHYPSNETALWHLLIWSILNNKPDLAHNILDLLTDKIGGSLMAFKLFNKMAEGAEQLLLEQLKEVLADNAKYFQIKAEILIDQMYKDDRKAAYICLVSGLPIHLGKQVHPLGLAYEANAVNFLNTDCCQTHLARVWMNYIRPDTPKLKLVSCLLVLLIPVLNLSVPYIFSFDDIYNAHGHGIPSQDKMDQQKLLTTYQRLKQVYQAPVSVFELHILSYLLMLGLFTHFVLTTLSPLDEANSFTLTEGLLTVIIFTFTFEVIMTIHHQDSLKYMGINLKLNRFATWLSNDWNKIDGIMITLYYIAFLMRFTVSVIDFHLVRFMFCVSLCFFYFRILKFASLFEGIGTNMILVKLLMKDFSSFVFCIVIFVLGFGIAFQSLLDPGHGPVFNLLTNIIWRPYWAMFGELYLDDIHTEMGRPVTIPRNCTTDRSMADENTPLCYYPIVPVMFGVYLSIVVLALLTMLIAVLSKSAVDEATQARKLWRRSNFETVRTYNYMAWLPPPLNLFCYLAKIILKIIERCSPSFMISKRDPKSLLYILFATQDPFAPLTRLTGHDEQHKG